MSNPFYDTFSTFQSISTFGNPTTITYQGTWGPNSSRTVAKGTATSNFPIQIYNNYFNVNGTESGIITYDTFSPSSSMDLSNITALNFPGSNASTNGVSVTVTINASNNTTTQTVGTTSTTFNTTSQTLVIPITNTLGVLSNATSISITLAVGGITTDQVYLGAFSSTFVCVAHGSNILTPLGYKMVQDLQRGDEIVGGKIARMIKTELHPKQFVEAVLFPPSSLEKNVPDKETIVCSEHYLVYRGKRRIGKCFLSYPNVTVRREEAEKILPVADDGKYYFYDIQFDHEGEYIVNGMISQSRSPYASVSPLPKELYFDEKNYKEEQVRNTLFEEPPISVKYLLPNGEESETFFKLVPRG